MVGDKKQFSNLGKLQGKSIQSFTNDNVSVKKTKNLLIKADEEVIDEFKIVAFDYYRKTKQLSLFSFRHYLAIVLYNMEDDFKKSYGAILEPDDDYLKFYQRRGNKASIEERDIKVMGNISFLLPLKYTELYYRLMHTYYINKMAHLSSYSISQFFYFINEYIRTADLKHYEIHI
ncbi:MAG: hypothetical protein EOP34_07400 [Rickettsiales bacterium]|nr:MAG: hypothetical protein EOP34_07400 [Rickettsiales bacterium]